MRGVTKVELLAAYRELVLELRDLEEQLELVGTDGRPAGYRGVDTAQASRGTNDPGAAAIQLAEGLEKRIGQKRASLAELAMPLAEVLSSLRTAKLFAVAQHYYVLGESDRAIAMQLRLSTSRINQLRNSLLRELAREDTGVFHHYQELSPG